ncbi:hypothetical protein bcgnr5372_53240 [Bacillus luti]
MCKGIEVNSGFTVNTSMKSFTYKIAYTIKKIPLNSCISTPSYYDLFVKYVGIIRGYLKKMYFSVIITFFCFYK